MKGDIYMKEITLKTLTRSGIPNVNGVVYSEKSFNQMVADLKERPIKLCLGMDYNNASFVEMSTIFPNHVIGDVKDIRDGEIDVRIPKDKFKYIEEQLNSEYLVPGMRYTGNVSKPDHNNIKEVTNMHLICYDLLRNPYKKK